MMHQHEKDEDIHSRGDPVFTLGFCPDEPEVEHSDASIRMAEESEAEQPEVYLNAVEDVPPLPSGSEDVGCECDFEGSEEDNDDLYSVHRHMNANKVTVGIQTSTKHFDRVIKSVKF